MKYSFSFPCRQSIEKSVDDADSSKVNNKGIDVTTCDEESRAILKPFDFNNDNVVSPEEVAEGAKLWEKSFAEKKRLKTKEANPFAHRRIFYSSDYFSSDLL